jgi:hypothetical protein
MLLNVQVFKNVSDGVANPVQQCPKFYGLDGNQCSSLFLKRFGRGCKPRPAMPKVLRFGLQPQYISLNFELNHAENSTQIFSGSHAPAWEPIRVAKASHFLRACARFAVTSKMRSHAGAWERENKGAWEREI